MSGIIPIGVRLEVLTSCLADLVLVIHLLFVLFVVLGALLLERWPRLMWLHLPAVFWGVYVELAGAICPLTPLEQTLRTQAGEASWSGGFVSHYLTSVLYPAGLTRAMQTGLGLAVVACNLVIYLRLAGRRRSRRSAGREVS